jgi:DNA-binding SARP family transcriptional activator
VLRISLLGELRLEVDGAPAELPASRRARSLLAWLALHPGEHPRSEVAGRFWPDVLDASARTSLRGALAELRRSLGGAGDDLVATRERVGLARAVQVDAAEFAAHLQAGRTAAALALVRGPLLADLDDDWIYPVRDAHRHEVIAAQGQLAAAAEERGDLAEAVALTRRQAALDPLSEELHRALMRRLAAAGDRAAAVGVYHALAERLRRDLGMAPAAETRALLAELRGGTPQPAAAAQNGDGSFPLPAPLALTRAPIVGREAELGALADAVREAAAGTARLVLVAGDPGIGKTTLAREAASRAAAAGAAVLYGRCDEDGIVPYEPWVQVADHAVAHASPALLERLATGVGPELARLAPELRRRVPDLPAPLQTEPDTERWRLFDALGGLLEEIAAERTAVVVLDDLHWADRSTLLLLRHLIRSRPHARLLVIGTYRAVELAPDAPLSAAIADLRREHLFTSIELGGLTEAQVAALVARRRGAAPEPGFARALHQETEGNPFFVEEVLRNVGERSEDRVPQGVREAVERRLARLSEPVRELLARAAVIGRDFDLALLERLTSATGDEVVARLEEAMRAQVIEEVGVGRYSFLHALIRATLYDGLSLTRRARLHLQIGQALEEAPGAPPYGELAHHYWVAAAGELDRVADYSARAARQALEQLAYDEAAGHAIRALQALDAGVPGDPGRRIELQLVLGEATDRAGDMPAARAAFADAAATARAAGDGAALATAALGLAGPSWRSFGEIDRDAVDLLEEALAGLGDGDPDLRARLLARLAIALYFASVPERVAALTAESAALARDHRAVAAALEARLYASWHPDGLADRLAAATELLALAEEDHRPELGALARRWAVVALLEAGEIERARAETAKHARTAATLRQPYEEMYAAVFGALWALLEGRFADAERHSATVLEAGQHRGGADALQFAGVHLISLAQERGGIGQLEPALRANAERYPAIPAWRSALAYALAESGRHDDARAELAELAPLAATLPRDANWFPGMVFAALAVMWLGDAALARELRAELEPYAGRCVLLGAGGALWGTVERYLGLLSLTAGDDERAARELERALERDEAMGARPWAAHARELLADALERLGDPRARALRDEAAATARELGMPRLLDQLGEGAGARAG